MEQLDAAGKLVKFAQGSLLFKQNDGSTDLFILKSGKVKVIRTEGGIDIELETLGPGSVVGELAGIDNGRRSASVVALEDTVAVMIPAAEFSSVIQKMPDWFRKIAQILAQRLREADERIDFNKGGDKTAHAAFLISLMSFSGLCRQEGEKLSFAVPDLENEIADLLGVQLSDATDILGRLQKQGLLRLAHGRIVIADREKLNAAGDAVFAKAEIAPTT